MRDQLVGRGHINAIHIRVPNRWCRGRKINPVCTRISRHLNNLTAGRAAHYGVVNQKHRFILKLQRHGIEFLAHGLLPLALPWHDESATNITVLHEPFTELHAQLISERLAGDTTGVRYRDYHINIVIRSLLNNLSCQRSTLPHTRLIDRDTIHERIRASEVNVLKDTGRQLGLIRTLFSMQLASLRDADGFTGQHIPQ